MKVRFPGDLKHRLTEAAIANSRSINAEIVQRLERSFGVLAQAPLDGDASKAILEIREMVTELHNAVKKPAPTTPWPLGKKAKAAPEGTS